MSEGIKSPDCVNCIHKDVCQFKSNLTEANRKIEELKTSYTKQPFEFEILCRYFTAMKTVRNTYTVDNEI